MLTSSVGTGTLSHEILRSAEHHLLPFNHKHAALSALGRLLEPDRLDESSARIAKQSIGQVLLGFEGSICFGTVGAEAVDCEAGGR